jgi:hypothetical protein
MSGAVAIASDGSKGVHPRLYYITATVKSSFSDTDKRTPNLARYVTLWQNDPVQLRRGQESPYKQDSNGITVFYVILWL